MANQEVVLQSLAVRLQRRYPGVRCCVKWSEFEPDPRWPWAKGHALWCVAFFAHDRETLIKHGLATAEQFEVDATLSYAKASRHHSMHDVFGGRMAIAVWPNDDGKGGKVFEVRTLVEDYHNADKIFTKKLQSQVERALKPFIRGTWKRPQLA